MLDAALQCAAEIAAKPPVAIWGTKQVIHYARDHSVDDSLKQMGWMQGAIWSNAHVREAVAAMKESARASSRPAALGLFPRTALRCGTRQTSTRTMAIPTAAPS